MFKKSIIFLFIFFWSCTEFQSDLLNKNKRIERVALPDAVIRDFSKKAYKMNRRLWVLHAKNAESFQNNQTTLIDLNVVFYDKKQKRSTKVVADYGLYYTKRQDFDLTSNVVIMSSNKKVLVGHFFHWDNQRETLTTPYIATISNLKTGEWHRGMGMIADKNLETVNFSSNSVGGFNKVEE